MLKRHREPMTDEVSNSQGEIVGVDEAGVNSCELARWRKSEQLGNRANFTREHESERKMKRRKRKTVKRTDPADGIACNVLPFSTRA